MRRLAAQFAPGTPGHLSSLLVTYCPILLAPKSEPVPPSVAVAPAQIMSALMPASVDGPSALCSLVQLLYRLKCTQLSVVIPGPAVAFKSAHLPMLIRNPQGIQLLTFVHVDVGPIRRKYSLASLSEESAHP